MSWMKRVLDYEREGYTEAEAYALVRAEREAAEAEAGDVIFCAAPEPACCCADDEEEGQCAA